MGIANKVFVGNKDILITTSDRNQNLFRFSSDGKFLNKIGNLGKGPGEYSDISTLQVIKDSNFPIIFIEWYVLQLKWWNTIELKVAITFNIQPYEKDNIDFWFSAYSCAGFIIHVDEE